MNMIMVIYILTVIAGCYTVYDFTIGKEVKTLRVTSYSLMSKMWLILVTIFMILK